MLRGRIIRVRKPKWGITDGEPVMRYCLELTYHDKEREHRFLHAVSPTQLFLSKKDMENVYNLCLFVMVDGREVEILNVYPDGV